jgi:glycosyltransferase involved in cell wall biosynthesis
LRTVSDRLVLDARLLHYNRTGVGRYVQYLYGAMASVDRGALEMVVAYHRKDRERLLRPAYTKEATLLTPGHHRLERWALAAELIRLRPALVHSPDHVCPQPLGWRTVLTVHDLAFWRFPETHSEESRAYYAGLRRSVQQAARVICVSEATRRDLLEACDTSPDKIRVVHEAADAHYGSPAPGRSPLASDRPFFIAVGTIEPRKNLAALIRAFAALGRRGAADESGKAPELLIAGGDGHGAAQIRALPVQLGIEGDVRFLGHTAAEELARLYRDAIALVYPSLMEGFGLPVLESMAAGGPVITSNRSSMAEVAGDAALLVDPMEEASIEEAMALLLVSADAGEALRRAGAIRVTQFSWERAAYETLVVFHEALGA